MLQREWIVVGSLTLAGAGVGFWLGWQPVSAPAAVVGTTSRVVEVPPARPGAAAVQRGSLGQTYAKLRERFPTEEQQGELAAHFFRAIIDLPASEFRSALGELSSADGDGESALDARVLLAGYWAERDLPAALAWARDVKDHALAEAVYQTWSRQNPGKFFEWAQTEGLKVTAEESRQALLSTVAQAGGLHDPQSGLAVLRRLQPSESDLGSAFTLYGQWARESPTAAAAHSVQEPGAVRRRQAIRAVAMEWVLKDPQAAFDWVSQELDPLGANDTWARMGFALAQERPKDGVFFVAPLPPTPEIQRVLLHALNSWVAVEPQAALQWATESSPPSLPQSIYQTALRSTSAGVRESTLRQLSPAGRARMLEAMVNVGLIDPAEKEAR